MGDKPDSAVPTQESLKTAPPFLSNEPRAQKEEKKKDLTFSLTSIADIQEDYLKPVYDAFMDLNKNVGNLNYKIADIVRKQSDDFVAAYKYEMTIIQRDLQEIRKKYEDFMVKANKSDHVQSLEKQLVFFRDEAQRMKELLEKREKEIAQLKSKISLLEDERRFLSEYIFKCVKQNKLIRIDKETKSPKKPDKNAPGQKGFRQQKYSIDKTEIFNHTKVPDIDTTMIVFNTGLEKLDAFLNQLKDRDFEDKYAILCDIEEFYKDLVTSYEHKIKDIKDSFMRQKARLQGGHFLKMMEKSDLADFFQECVDKVKTNIIKRRTTSRQERLSADKRKRIMEPPQQKVTEADFLLSDKQALLEAFLSNDTVVKLVKYLMLWSGDRRDTRTTNDALDQSLYLKKGDNDSDLSMFTNILNETKMNFAQNSYTGPSPDVVNYKLPQLTEGDIAHGRRKVSNSVDVNPYEPTTTKFNQLFGSPKVTPFKPKSASTAKEVVQSYNY